MKIVIVIFVLPYEIDDLDYTITQLKLASKHISKNFEWMIDVTLCTSSDLTNWEASPFVKQYFLDKFSKISKKADWCTSSFSASHEIKGCVSKRRASLDQHPDTDYFIWLDCDIIFPEKTLFFFEQAIELAHKKSPLTIITPEIVRIWDSTWDCLVNENFLSKEISYQKNNDPYNDAGIYGQLSLELVENKIPGQPRYKFAGGWLTCLSRALLAITGIPQSFGHYGYEDTFIMWASEHLNKKPGYNIIQFKIKNLVVCENYRYRSNSYKPSFLVTHDKREEYLKIARDNFQKELNKLLA
jgi:hypothetical protein